MPWIPRGSAKAEHDSEVKGFKSQSPLALLPAASCSQAKILMAVFIFTQLGREYIEAPRQRLLT